MDWFNSVVSPLLTTIDTWVLSDWLTLCAVVSSFGALVLSGLALRCSRATARTVELNLEEAHRIVEQNRDRTAREELKRQIKDNRLCLYRVTQLAKKVFEPWQHLNGMDGEVGASMAQLKTSIRKAQKEQDNLAKMNVAEYGHSEIEEILTRIHNIDVFLRKNEDDLKRFELWASNQDIPTDSHR